MLHVARKLAHVMSEPGYYKTNHRALSLRGMARVRGFLRAPFDYLITRFMAPAPVAWMPQLWADLDCAEQELSSDFFRATAAYREAFRALGFTEVGCKKLKRILNPRHRDSGGINFLDRSRSHFGQLIYNRSYVPAPVNGEREQVVISFTAAFGMETLSYTNNTKTPFDSVPHHSVVRIQSANVGDIYQRFAEDAGRRPEQPCRFVDLPSLRQWFDANAVEVFEYRVRRGLFVRMSEREVAVARRRLTPPLPN